MFRAPLFAVLALLLSCCDVNGDKLRGTYATRELKLRPMTGMTRSLNPAQSNTENFLFEVVFQAGADPPADVLCMEKTIKNSIVEVAKKYFVEKLGYHPSVEWGDVLELKYVEQAKEEEKAKAEQEFDAVKVVTELALDASSEQLVEEMLRAEIEADQQRLTAIEQATDELKKNEESHKQKLKDTQKGLEAALVKYNDAKQKATDVYDGVVAPAKELEIKKSKEAEAAKDNALSKATSEKEKKSAEREFNKAKEAFLQEFLSVEVPARHTLLATLEEPSRILKDLENSLQEQMEGLKDCMKEMEDSFEKAKMMSDEVYKREMEKAKNAKSRKEDKAKEFENEAMEQALEKKTFIIESAREEASELKAKFHAHNHDEQLVYGGDVDSAWSASFVVSVTCNDGDSDQQTGSTSFCTPERSMDEESRKFKKWMSKGTEAAIASSCPEAKKLDHVNFYISGN